MLKNLFQKQSGNKKRTIRKKNKKKNPYKDKKDPGSYKKTILLIVVISTLITVIILLLKHPFFQIKKIQISGNKKIKKQELKWATKGIYSHKKLFFFPANNYFLINKKNIKKILKEKFPIRKISLEKDFPNTLNMKVEEKINTIIYDNGVKYSYIDQNGKIIQVLSKIGENEWKKKKIKTREEEGVNSTTIKKIHKPDVLSVEKQWGKLPIIYDTRGKKAKPKNKVIDKDTVKSVVDWYRMLNNKSDLDFKYSKVASSSENFIINTSQNWNIKADSNKETAVQFKKLKYLINNKIQQDEPEKYIDVRFENKVYWK
ncbi:MAG: cell division protein FtsQ/DivIB [Candidatus Magasanikbacteria bacterium]